MTTIVLGAGATGLAAGITAPNSVVYEASDSPGGLCYDYKIGDFTFSKGGGHFLFGAEKNPLILAFLKSHCTLKRYERRASVYFPDEDRFYPYPLQADLGFQRTIQLETAGEYGGAVVTMKDAMHRQFGTTACAKFFDPFNELYTAGLYDKVAPQDAYKSPKTGSGYNVNFYYPQEGLGHLARRMAALCNIRFNKRAQWIDVREKMVHFDDDTCQGYDRLISTLPLNWMMEMTALHQNVGKPDPHVGVVVLNIGAKRGAKCPDDHWIYFNKTKSGMHRLGVYSNVDSMFAPSGHVSMYAERAYLGGVPFVDAASYTAAVVDELREWQWIGDVDVYDETSVEVAYTYRWPRSLWRGVALEMLKEHDIYSIGRFGAWKFQGIVESMKEGFEVGCQMT